MFLFNLSYALTSQKKSELLPARHFVCFHPCNFFYILQCNIGFCIVWSQQIVYRFYQATYLAHEKLNLRRRAPWSGYLRTFENSNWKLDDIVTSVHSSGTSEADMFPEANVLHRERSFLFLGQDEQSCLGTEGLRNSLTEKLITSLFYRPLLCLW